MNAADVSLEVPARPVYFPGVNTLHVSSKAQRRESEKNVEALSSPLRNQFSWTLPANAIYALSGWLLLVVLNKSDSPVAAGQFGLALAICAPAIMFGNLRLSVILATDPSPRIRLASYFKLRAIFMVFAVLWVAAAILLSDRLGIVPLLIVVLLAKVVESFSDLCCGVQQKVERMDRIAVSLALNGVLMFAAFTATFLLTKNMVYAAGGILIARLVTLLAFDLPMARRAAGLPLFSEAVAEENEETRAYTSAIFCQALPLGITTVLLSLTSNIPRYLIADMHSEHLLGIFCSMAAVMQAGTLVFRAIELPTTPRLARLIREKDGRRFWRILNALLAIFLVVGLLGAAVSLVVGPRLLSIVFTPEYASMGGLLALLVLATAISQMAGMIEASMIAARMIKVQLPLHLVTTGLCLLAGWMLIPRYELAGAVIALTICRIPFMVFGVLLLRQKLRAGCSQPREPKANTEEEASPTDSRLINRRVA